MVYEPIYIVFTPLHWSPGTGTLMILFSSGSGSVLKKNEIGFDSNVCS